MANRILGMCPLHYGAEYLSEAIQAVAPFVEKIIVLYTPTPSFGFGTSQPCPETDKQLCDIAVAASDKVEWVQVKAGNEGSHREEIMYYAPGYEGILAFDADEVFEPADLPQTLEKCANSNQRYIGFSGYINFWKSFNYACYDSFTPIRYINLHNSEGSEVVNCRVYHFSTAQSDEIMRYKLEIHGHRDEIRPNWYEGIYKAWQPGIEIENGLHLVANGLWLATPFDKNTLPELLKKHPNFNKDVIE